MTYFQFVFPTRAKAFLQVSLSTALKCGTSRVHLSCDILFICLKNQCCRMALRLQYKLLTRIYHLSHFCLLWLGFLVIILQPHCVLFFSVLSLPGSFLPLAHYTCCCCLLSFAACLFPVYSSTFILKFIFPVIPSFASQSKLRLSIKIPQITFFPPFPFQKLSWFLVKYSFVSLFIECL